MFHPDPDHPHEHAMSYRHHRRVMVQGAGAGRRRIGRRDASATSASLRALRSRARGDTRLSPPRNASEELSERSSGSVTNVSRFTIGSIERMLPFGAQL
jgi:hypothetical protein